jgi:hypothetical protein
VDPRLQLKYPENQLGDEITTGALGSAPGPSLQKYFHAHKALVLLGWVPNRGQPNGGEN